MLVPFAVPAPERSVAIHLVCTGKTDVGLKRQHNEDSLYYSQERAICLLADGMGGREFGEVASKLCVDTLNGMFATSFPETLRGRRLADDPDIAHVFRMLFDTWLRDANTAIRAHSFADQRFSEMGTTICSLYYQEDFVVVAHVGDSRIYRIRGGAIEAITEDHSLVNEQLKANLISAEEAATSRLRNILVRAMGPAANVQPDVSVYPAVAGDVYLLCSDGLSDLVSDLEILETVQEQNGDMDDAAAALVDFANARGGKDNITVILARLEPGVDA